MKIKYIHWLLTSLMFIAHANIHAQKVDHWESMILVGDSCKYFVPESEIGDSWKFENFDDASWSTGKSGLGYGDDDDSTLLKEGTQCVYMRFNFIVESKSDIAMLFLDMDYDDGFIAYLNGQLVARGNIKKHDNISWDMELKNDHEARLRMGVNPERFDLSHFMDTLLQEGNNLLAIEIHNQVSTSSDLSSNVFLHAGLRSSDSVYRPVPDWFGEQFSFHEFNLPLMMINTNGQQIPDEPRIVADMGIVYNGYGSMNRLEDAWNEYSGKISIEQRGESSIDFLKRSYSIELQLEDGSNNNVSILGLPAENDFVLYGPFSDQTMIKNVLTYELFRRTGRWAPRTRYIELVINGIYDGVYVLTEKNKRDKNRVDIDKITAEDFTPEEISGGYILRRDKTNKLEDWEWWTSPVEQPYHQRMWYEYYDPEIDDLTYAQAYYIKNWMQGFDEVMSGNAFNHPRDGYRKYIRTRSFIDMMFINEISKGIDNYLFSTYFYKENDNDGGQLVAGPPWDYNLGYGNLNYGEDWNAAESYGWSYPQGGRVYWYERLMEDEVYQDKVFCRWTQHRANIFSDESVLNIIDSCVTVLGGAIDRNAAKYSTLGHYLWPAIEPFPTTYQGEVEKLKSWLLDRLAWMDGEWKDKGYCAYEKPDELLFTTNDVFDTTPIGSVVGVLSTVDVDSDTHYYSLVRGNGDDDNEKFTIEDNLVLSNTDFEQEDAKEFSIRVESVDDEMGSIEESFVIYVLTTAVNDSKLADVNSIVIYPNPSNDGVMIGGLQMPGETLEIKVLNVSGRLLYAYSGSLHQINKLLFTDTQTLEQGIYFIKLWVSGQQVTRKLIKL